ncbi:5-methyltetrahydrofolate--homocysteine methyltransferase [Candidatus Formimonas warabiya]|uniref:5-methyltetrahydrofolate--homocysteine methyltransferase n=2 Tax=Formimonas warabiya TaxID=1761012 RepID=A0A3G1L147_FORW1|nr:5-methyltetrahydrofolate--homocysteine methyltransferase [Candidatus Formimonas warabiya]
MNIEELTNGLVELQGEKVTGIINDALREGINPLELVEKLQKGMVMIGEKFSRGEYFLSELIMSGEIMKEAMAIIEPKLAGVTQETKGTVVIGTVRGDIHDLGKNIVVMLLKGSGYHVIDLGVDVPEAKVVQAVQEHKPGLLGLSVLLTGCQDAMKETISAVKAAGLTDVKVLIGGNYVDEKVLEFCGADYFGKSADEAVTVADQVFGVSKK